MTTETPAPTDVVTDTGAEIGLTDAERAEVENAKTEAATPAAAPAPAPAPAADAATTEEEDDDAPAAQGGDVATLAAAAVQAAQAATAAVGELAAQRAAAAAPAPAPAAPAEPDWAAQKSALKAKYDAGELDDDEYEAKREELIEQRADYNATKRAEQIVSQRLAKAEETSAEQRWNTAFGAFSADPDNAAFIADPVRATAFNATLQAIAKQNPAKSYAELLVEARDTVRTAFGLANPTAQANAAAVKKAEAERAKARPPAPPDITRAPNAGTPGGGDNFAQLDAMNIDDLENALARMTPDQRNAYLESAPGGLRDNPRATV